MKLLLSESLIYTVCKIFKNRFATYVQQAFATLPCSVLKMEVFLKQRLRKQNICLCKQKTIDL